MPNISIKKLLNKINKKIQSELKDQRINSIIDEFANNDLQAALEDYNNVVQCNINNVRDSEEVIEEINRKYPE